MKHGAHGVRKRNEFHQRAASLEKLAPFSTRQQRQRPARP
jgi:hypothetical protein